MSEGKCKGIFLDSTRYLFNTMRVLGIETSCDETGVAIYDGGCGLLGHLLHSQVELHAQYGGVVPELASRDHIQRLIPLIDTLLRETGTDAAAIGGVAYTAGPGLAGALLVGAAVGCSLAFGWGKPAIGVHHLEGHLLAPMLEPDQPEFPYLALLVSGGHTQIVRVDGVGDYILLGDTLDDAVGEAFDKTASLLGLDYPGGAALAELALRGDPARFRFPRPMTDRPGLDMSFSGLKTFALQTFRKHQAEVDIGANIARAFEEAVAETLRTKCHRALRDTQLSCLVVSGGVSANRRLRATLSELGEELQVRVCYPRFEFCTDNGAMIAYAGYQRLVAGERTPLGFKAKPRWPLEELRIPEVTKR